MSKMQFELIKIVNKSLGYQPIFLFFRGEARNVG